MRDRAMQALYLSALEPVCETLADPNSYGFRKGRNTADAIGQCFTVLAKKDSPQWVLEADIRGCFDHISHPWMLEHVPMDKVILKKWLKTGYMEEGVMFATEEGTPQGGIISPTLANFTLDGLEKFLRSTFKCSTKKGKYYNPKVHLVRYADDFIITGSCRELLENEVLPRVKEFLQKRGLELSEEKTLITHIKEGFNFLGQDLRKYNDRLLIKPSQKSVKAIKERIKALVKTSKTEIQGVLIERLNPIIRGWANYHRHCSAKQTFSKIDYDIWLKLRRWCLRRHPNKRSEWVFKKYFHKISGRKWTFAVGTGGQAEDTIWTQLIRLADTKIQRHCKIKGDANPFDPEWYAYFAIRSSEWRKSRASSKQQRDNDIFSFMNRPF
jgi:RNA-directed DNA polymerase